MAEYIWIDSNGGVSSKSKVSHTVLYFLPFLHASRMSPISHENPHEPSQRRSQNSFAMLSFSCDFAFPAGTARSLSRSNPFAEHLTDSPLHRPSNSSRIQSSSRNSQSGTLTVPRPDKPQVTTQMSTSDPSPSSQILSVVPQMFSS
jgi:hypothetical protein